MADRTVTTRLRLDVAGWKAGSRAVESDLKSLNRSFVGSAGFAKGFRRSLEDATKRLPPIEIDLNSSPAEVKLAVVRGELEKLARREIGVDIDAGAAFTELAALERELASLEDEASFEVRASIQQALADIATVQTEIARLDDRRIRLNVDTGLLDKATAALGPRFEAAFDVIGKAGPANTAIAGAAIAGLPVVAVAAAGLIVTALGGALTAVGITGAAQAPVVQKAWTRAGEEIKKTFAEVAEPFEGSLISAASVAQETFSRLAPTLRSTFRDLVPDVDRFIKTWGDGVASLAPGVSTLGRGFGSILDGLSDRAPAIFGNLNSALVTLGSAAERHADTFAGMIEGLTVVVDKGADAVSTIADLGAAAAEFKGAGDILGVDMTVGVLNLFDSKVDETAAAIGTMASSLRSASEEAITLQGGVRGLNAALEESFAPQQTLLEATNDWSKTLAKVNKDLDQGNLSTLTRTLHLEELLDELAKMAQAEMTATNSTVNSTRAFEANVGSLVKLAGSSATGRAALDGLAEGLGYTIERSGNATIVVDKFGNAVKVLPNGKVVKLSTEAAMALAKLKETENAIARIRDKVVNVSVITTYWSKSGQEALNRKQSAPAESGAIFTYGGGQITKAFAAGGIETYASGGMRRPGPHIANEPTVLYGEGRGPEAFIPYEQRYRQRAVDLLGQVAEDFGLEVYSRRAADRMSDAGMVIDAAGMQISAGLDEAMAVVLQTLGGTGTLTSEIMRVGQVGGQMTAGWQQGAQVLGESVTGMGETVGSSVAGMSEEMTTSIDFLSASVDVLGEVVAKAAEATKGKTSSTNSSSYGKGGGASQGQIIGPNFSSKKKSGSSSSSSSKSKGKKGGGASEGAIIGPNFSAKPKPEPGGLVEGSGPAGGYSMAYGGWQMLPGSAVNTAKVSAPQQMPYQPRPSSGVAGGEAGGGPGGGVSPLARPGPLVSVENLQVREQADVDLVAEKLHFKATSRG
ncbi:hypothetical protein ACIBEJ_48660 [Nonomuraea sp. NPDC050790]|uniref:hypothetical protein n=1 Tax=Nonomuraea sp. NPDC050790 TaxID=3364371 RepID=UPI00379A01AD